MRRTRTNPRERVPAECFPIGEFIQEELESRGWSKESLAGMIGWQRDVLDRVLEGTEPLTKEQAEGLEQGFRVSYQYWLNLDIAYRRWRRLARAAALPGEGTGEGYTQP